MTAHPPQVSTRDDASAVSDDLCAVHVDRLPVISLLPNLRLFQCFLTETFDQLRSSFLVVFQIYVRPPNSREQLVNDDGDDSEMQLLLMAYSLFTHQLKISKEFIQTVFGSSREYRIIKICANNQRGYSGNHSCDRYSALGC
ncbi:MAG: hypothetical protein J3Q66DRAFT_404724 [Benniella sp.]|nr:MAG: hypothetical protein J3Q66DRAFT_404724 [Benniella sp.]